VSRLVGAPPGYVGYDEGGQLTEAVRRKPYAVVLLDEIEKAHPDVFNVLLQVLDDGRLTDGQGRVVDFKNTVLIMTSNVGRELRATFRPEFLNRIDDIVFFAPLGKEQLAPIIRIQVARFAKLLADKGLTMKLTDRAVAAVAEEGYDPTYGARPLKRAISTLIIDPLALELLAGHFRAGDHIVVDVGPDGLRFEKAHPQGAAA
jgi:ATP-dependent Clp protease ATP-binding subunit ClpB